MASSDKTVTFTPAQFDQLLTYIRWAEESGDYYGNRKQFVQRHNAICQRMKEAEGDEDGPR